MPAPRQATSTLEFLLKRDESAARLPVFTPAVRPPKRRLQAPVFVALLATGLVLAAIAAFLLT